MKKRTKRWKKTVLTGRTGGESGRAEGGKRSGVVRVPSSRGGGVLHARGRVSGGGGRGESGERRGPDGRDGMVLMVVSAGSGRGGGGCGRTGHHERGAGYHRAAGLLERMVSTAVQVLAVVRQRRGRVYGRHG